MAKNQSEQANQKTPEWVKQYTQKTAEEMKQGAGPAADLEEEASHNSKKYFVIRMGTEQQVDNEHAAYFYHGEKQNGEDINFNFHFADIRKAVTALNLQSAGIFDISQASPELMEVIALQIQKDRAAAYLLEHADDLPEWAKNNKDLAELAPALLNELYNYKLAMRWGIESTAAKEAAKQATLLTILKEGFTTRGRVKARGNKWAELIKTARENQASYNITPLKLSTRVPNKIDYPIDKIDNEVWGDLAENSKNKDGQYQLVYLKKSQAFIIWEINFNALEDLIKKGELKITRELTHFDKRVYIACCSIYAYNSRSYTTINEIYKTMGGKGTPADSQIKAINDSITKMQGAHIYYDNGPERSEYRNYNKIRYDGSLLPMERITGYVNGNLTDGVINLLREPPLMDFARKHNNQITTFKQQLLATPLNMTEHNLQIEDSLLRRLAYMKSHPKAPRTILFDSLFSECGNDGKSEKHRKQRTRDKSKDGPIITALEHYKAVGELSFYKVTDRGIENIKF